MQTRACQRCWHRKQKCDRQSPECSACVTVGVQCLPRTYGQAQDSFAGTDSQSQPRSSIEYMKQRIQYLENDRQRHGQATSNRTPNSHVSPTQAGHSRRLTASSTNLEHTAPGPVVDVATNEVEYLSLTAMSGGDKGDSNIPSSSTFGHVTESILSLDGTNPSAVRIDGLSTVQLRPTLGQIEVEVNSAVGKDYLYLIRAVAADPLWHLPYISEITCLTALDTARRAETGPISVPLATSTSDASAVACMVLALGITLSSYHKTLHNQVLKLIDLSKEALRHVLTTAEDSTSIQCLVLLMILSLYHPSAGSSWHLLGLTLSKAVSAGLHRSDSVDATNEEGKQAAAIFWMLCVLDRTITGVMGRPLGLEDDDVALELPELQLKQSSDDITAIREAIFIWRVHYARLLSQWRQPSNFDIDANFASYEYWKECYHELCERLNVLQTTESQAGELAPALHSVMRKDEVALSCRGLVHLLDSATRFLPDNTPSLVKLKQHIVTEASHYIDVMHNIIEDGGIALTFLDGYDAFAAAVMYVFCIYDPLQPVAFRLGIAQMKTITASIDIIQSISQEFKPLRAFKDIVWALLQTLEARAEGRDVSGSLRSLTGCDVQIPSHIQRLIQLCTQM